MGAGAWSTGFHHWHAPVDFIELHIRGFRCSAEPRGRCDKPHRSECPEIISHRAGPPAVQSVSDSFHLRAPVLLRGPEVPRWDHGDSHPVGVYLADESGPLQLHLEQLDHADPEKSRRAEGPAQVRAESEVLRGQQLLHKPSLLQNKNPHFSSFSAISCS